MTRARQISTLAVIALYWAAGVGAGPAWTSWVETLMPSRIRARYLAWRTRIGQAGTLLGFVAGGGLLQWGSRCGHRLLLFAALFAVAAAGRLMAAWFLARRDHVTGLGPQPDGEPEGPVVAVPQPTASSTSSSPGQARPGWCIRSMISGWCGRCWGRRC